MSWGSSALSRDAEPSDAQLVAQVLSGDDAGYATLVNRHQHLLYRHARGMGLDHDTSLDIIQDAFVRAYARLADCREGARYRSWLFRICRNLCLDELRSVRRLTVPMSTIENARDIVDPRTPEDDLMMTLQTALARLPDALREAFLLKHDAGYTYEEVAEIAEASPSAIKMRVHRAREALRAFLRGEGIGQDFAPDDESDDPLSGERLMIEERQDRSTSVAGVDAMRTSHSRRTR